MQPNVLHELGFDEFCMWTGYETGNPASTERYWNPYLHTVEGSRTYDGEFGPDVCNRFVLDFIGRQSADEPFFVYYPMILTHGPLTSTPHRPVAAGKRRHRAMVEYMDQLVGNIVQALDETGQRDNTIVIWTTDNGTSGGISNRMHGRLVAGAKGKTLENGVCEPFIVNCPGLVPAGIRTDALTDFTDLLPTFADLGGAALPADDVIDGSSLAPLILGQADDGPRTWIMAMGGGAGTCDRQGHVINVYRYRDRVIRDKRYKLYIETDRSPAKLVDLKQDPAEMHNLLDDAKYAPIIDRLRQVEQKFPATDGAPRYTALSAQTWDRKIRRYEQRSDLKGLPTNALRPGRPAGGKSER